MICGSDPAPMLALPRVAAVAANVQPATLRQWVHRGHIPPPVDGLYDLAAILAYLDRRSVAAGLVAKDGSWCHA